MGRSTRPRKGKSRQSNLLGRSLDLLRGVSGRVQKEAERAWRLSGLRVQAATLRRKRVEALTRLGEEVQRMLQAGEIASTALKELSGRIARLDRKLGLAERTIGRAERLQSRRLAASEDKALRPSKRLELVPVSEAEAAASEREKPALRKSGRAAAGSDRQRRTASERAAERASSRPRAAAPLPIDPIDPLEDILGAAEEEGLEADEAGERTGSSPVKPRR